MMLISSFPALLKTAKVQMGFFLLLIAITAIFNSYTFISFFTFFLALFTTLFSDFIFITLRKVKPFFPSAAIVSGLIIGLLTFYQLPWYQIVLTGVIAMGAKNFIRIRNRHIFNPAGFGLFFTSLIFHQTVSWWGVSFQILSANILSVLAFLILLSPGFVSLIRMKRYMIPLSYFCVSLFLQILVRIFQHTFNPFLILEIIFLSSTILFFSFVMLPEPMTSPNTRKRQVLYGSFVAILTSVFSLFFSKYLPDPFITALLFGNAVFFNFK